jgi:mono/diheme cytochrome c family protein
LLAFMTATSSRAGLAPQAAYQLHCMGCHGAGGSGDATRVPSVNQAMLRFARTAEGRNYLVRVPGIATSPLSDADLTALLNWMLEDFGAPGAPASPAARGAPAAGSAPTARDTRGAAPPPKFSVAEVSQARRKPLADVAAARLRVLAQQWP